MSILNTQVQNVTVKTLQLSHFAVSYAPAFKFFYITITDIFEEIVLLFNHYGFYITSCESKGTQFALLSVGDKEFRVEADEIELIKGFLFNSNPASVSSSEA